MLASEGKLGPHPAPLPLLQLRSAPGVTQPLSRSVPTHRGQKQNPLMRHLAQPRVSQACSFQKRLQTQPALAHRLTGELQNEGTHPRSDSSSTGLCAACVYRRKSISHPQQGGSWTQTTVSLGYSTRGVVSEGILHQPHVLKGHCRLIWPGSPHPGQGRSLDREAMATDDGDEVLSHSKAVSRWGGLSPAVLSLPGGVVGKPRLLVEGRTHTAYRRRAKMTQRSLSAPKV